MKPQIKKYPRENLDQGIDNEADNEEGQKRLKTINKKGNGCHSRSCKRPNTVSLLHGWNGNGVCIFHIPYPLSLIPASCGPSAIACSSFAFFIAKSCEGSEVMIWSSV